MKKLHVLSFVVICTLLLTGSAMADSIQGKIGVTGKIGFLIPSDGDFDTRRNGTDTGFVGGGGVIYGFDKNIAGEIDITRTEFGSDNGDFGTTNISLGAQYRFLLSETKVVPYVGGGLDLLMNDSDRRYDVDTTLGIHLSGGVDFFVTKQIALTAEAKLVLAPDADISEPSGKRGNFDPSSFSTLFGVRYFFN